MFCPTLHGRGRRRCAEIAVARMILRRFNQAELVLTQRLHLERPLLVLVAVGSAGYMLGRDDITFFLLLALGIVVNAMALYLRSEIALPRPVVTVSVLLATGFFVFDFFGHDFFLAIGHYISLLLLCKLLERKRNRDYAEMIVLTIMLMLDGAMVTVSLGYALLLLLFVPLACYVAMVLTLKIALDRQAGLQLSVERHSPDPQTLAWNMTGRFPARTIATQALHATVQCVLAAAVVYLLMPRIPPGDLMARLGLRSAGTGSHTTGMPSSFRLTDLGRITPDPRVVMQVKITDAYGKDLGQSGYIAYLRGNVYEGYRDGEWLPEPARAVSGQTGPLPGNLIIQRVTMDPSLASNVFAIAPTVGLWGQDDSSVRSPHDLLEQKAEDAPIRYIVYSWKTPYTPRQWRQLGRWARRDAQEPKESDTIAPRVSQLAGEWCADLLAERDRARLFGAAQQDIDRVNRKIAERLVDKLREGYEYTLDLSAFAPDVDPVEDFLFNTKRGHCEFFASAMTLMARSLALEARMCGGFLADERSYSKSSGYYLVRASDAHAWVEIYYPSADWVLYDPTPPGSTNEPPGRTQRLRHFWDDIHFLWRTRIIGYGEAQRQGLFGTFLDRLRSGVNWAVARLKETAKSVMDILRHGPDRALLLRLLPGLSLVLAGSALVLLAIELWRRHRRKRRMLVRPHHAPRFYRRLHRLLERRGVDQRLDQTPREYLVQAAKELHLSRPLMGDLADMLYTSRWGERPLTEEQVCQAEDSVKQVAVQLKRR